MGFEPSSLKIAWSLLQATKPCASRLWQSRRTANVVLRALLRTRSLPIALNHCAPCSHKNIQFLSFSDPQSSLRVQYLPTHHSQPCPSLTQAHSWCSQNDRCHVAEGSPTMLATLQSFFSRVTRGWSSGNHQWLLMNSNLGPVGYKPSVPLSQVKNQYRVVP